MVVMLVMVEYLGHKFLERGGFVAERARCDIGGCGSHELQSWGFLPHHARALVGSVQVGAQQRTRNQSLAGYITRKTGEARLCVFDVI